MTELTKQRVRWIAEQGDLYRELRRERRLIGVLVALQLVYLVLDLAR